MAGCAGCSAKCWRMKQFQDYNGPVDERIRRQMRARGSKRSKTPGFLIVLLALHGVAANAARTGEPEPPRLKSATRQAFDRYVALTEARNEAELKRDTNLLWVDALREGQRGEAYAALQRGEVKMQKLETLDNRQIIPCPGGMIHHWTWLVLIPRAALDEVRRRLGAYDN